MNIFKRELKANLLSLLIWAAPIMIVMYAASIEFEFFAGDPTIAAAMESFEILFKALGAPVSNMTTPEGFISLVSIYIYLPLSIYSGLLGSGIISKEEKDKTAEYLFTLPIKRERAITSKVLVSLLYSAVINILTMGTVYFVYSVYDVSSTFNQFIINMSIGVFLTQIVFLGIGMSLSAILKQFKKSGGITIGILMSAFMVSILIGMVDGKLDFVKFAIPFQYFPAADMLANDFNIGFTILAIGIFVSTIAATYIFYKRRDLYI